MVETSFAVLSDPYLIETQITSRSWERDFCFIHSLCFWINCFCLVLQAFAILFKLTQQNKVLTNRKWVKAKVSAKRTPTISRMFLWGFVFLQRPNFPSSLHCFCLLGGGDLGHQHHQGHPDRKVRPTAKGWYHGFCGRSCRRLLSITFSSDHKLECGCQRDVCVCVCFLTQLMVQRWWSANEPADRWAVRQEVI